MTGFLHHCRAWHCKFVSKAADDKRRPCELHGVEHMLVTAEVRQLGFHELGRSHASLLAHAAVSTAVTQKLMRHSVPKLTERVYTLVDVEALRREVERPNFKPLLTRLLPERSENAPQAKSSGRERKEKRRDSKDLDDVTPARFERATGRATAA